MTSEDSKKPKQALVLSGLLLGPLVIFIAYVLFRSKEDLPVIDAPLAEVGAVDEVEVGGVMRPRSDVSMPAEAVEALAEARQLQKGSVPRRDGERDPNQFPSLNESMNANVSSVIEAVRTGAHPERLTPNIAPQPFNRAVFDADPQAYLDVVEPGRVYQSAQPGPGVKSIGVAGKRRQTIRQLESVRLSVKVAPSAPVSFTSLDLGAFENRLPSITVLSDEKGLASAVFTGTAGTTDEVNILAASPVTSGRIEFVVTVVE